MDQAAYFAQMRQRRRAEILLCARKMFLTQGIAAFNIQQLARDLDISTVTLYKYFKNSDDILIALREQILQEIQEISFAENLSRSGTPLESLQTLLKNFYTEVLRKKDDLSLLLLSDWHPSSGKTINENIFQPYINRLEEPLLNLLHLAESEDYLKADLNITDSYLFLQQMNLTMLEHIALLKDVDFSGQKKELLTQIQRLISFFIFSIQK